MRALSGRVHFEQVADASAAGMVFHLPIPISNADATMLSRPDGAESGESADRPN